jgi:hypothetical protein
LISQFSHLIKNFLGLALQALIKKKQSPNSNALPFFTFSDENNQTKTIPILHPTNSYQ